MKKEKRKIDKTKQNKQHNKTAAIKLNNYNKPNSKVNMGKKKKKKKFRRNQKNEILFLYEIL